MKRTNLPGVLGERARDVLVTIDRALTSSGRLPIEDIKVPYYKTLCYYGSCVTRIPDGEKYCSVHNQPPISVGEDDPPRVTKIHRFRSHRFNEKCGDCGKSIGNPIHEEG